MHAAGWLGGRLTASFDKLIVDAELLQMMAARLVPPAVDRDSLAVPAIAEFGHGSHFFGAAHTIARYQRAFYQPLVSDRANFDNWRDRGSPSTAERAAPV